jgi:polycomb protein EED
MAGPAHGLHMYESEGEGLGRCMYVLMGGRSGGHQAAVLASVKYSITISHTGSNLLNSPGFSSTAPANRNLWRMFFFSPPFCLIIYSQLMPILQMDRTVKIWVIRATTGVGIRREDKPVFSSGRIHKARVLSVTW